MELDKKCSIKNSIEWAFYRGQLLSIVVFLAPSAIFALTFTSLRIPSFLRVQLEKSEKYIKYYNKCFKSKMSRVETLNFQIENKLTSTILSKKKKKKKFVKRIQ